MKWLKDRVCAPSVQQLLLNIETYIDKIPEEERWNLHYTLCECEDSKSPRRFAKQDIIPFDIDGIDLDRINDYIEPCLRAIGNLSIADTAVVKSGRGLHFLVGTDTPIVDKEYFKETAKYYKIVADRIDRTLKSLDLPGSTDLGLWSAGHTLRLPMTKNIKTKKEGYSADFEGECVLHTRVLNLIPELTIMTLAGIDEGREDEYINIKTKAEGGNYIIDQKGVMDCNFLQHCIENAATIKEPEWREMLGIVARLDNGRELCHQFSEGHPDYSYDDTESKIDSRVASAGPGLCKTIETRIGFDCSQCPHYNKVNSPVSIRSKDFIPTKETGFRKPREDKNGIPHPGKVEYEDLRRYFDQLYEYKVTSNKMVYTWNGTHYEYLPDVFLDGFVQDHVDPAPRSTDRNEFSSLIHCTNLLQKEDFFETTTYKKMNLRNGILDLSGDKPVLSPHSKEVGFLSILNYDYDPEALCPQFDQFLEDVTLERSDLSDIIMEYVGYAFSNDKCNQAKALILLGEGANGKSTLLDIIQEIAGEGSYSGLSLTDLNKEQQRDQLRGKLFNVSDEIPRKAFFENSIFKNIVSGGIVTVKVLYKQPFTMRIRAKLIVTANRLPQSFDSSRGFFRRLLIIPFDAHFEEGKNRDENIFDKLIEEASGILNKAIKGYKRLQKQRRFTVSTTVEQEIKEMEMDTNPVLCFVKEKTRVEDYRSERGDSVASLYDTFRRYCEDEGVKFILNKRQFLNQLKFTVPDLDKRVYRRGIKKVTEYKGIFLVNDESYATHDELQF